MLSYTNILYAAKLITFTVITRMISKYIFCKVIHRGMLQRNNPWTNAMTHLVITLVWWSKHYEFLQRTDHWKFGKRRSLKFGIATATSLFWHHHCLSLSLPHTPRSDTPIKNKTNTIKIHDNQLSTVNLMMIYHNYPLPNKRRVWIEIGVVHVLVIIKCYIKI